MITTLEKQTQIELFDSLFRTNKAYQKFYQGKYSLICNILQMVDNDIDFNRNLDNIIATYVSNPKYYDICGYLETCRYFRENKENINTSLYFLVKRNTEKGIYDTILTKKYTSREFDYFEKHIDFDRNYTFPYMGIRQACDKYLLRNKQTGEYYEDIQQMFMLIGMTLFANYPYSERAKWVLKFYDAVSQFKISLPTPFFTGVRTKVKQGASCVLINVGDSIESISTSLGAVFRYISKGAGIGLNMGRIRAKGSAVRNGEVIHTGVIPFLKTFESTVKSCTQQSRGGSATVYFPFWHREIEDILVLKNNKGNDENRVRHLDYGIQLNRLVYERLLQNKNLTLFSPHEVPEMREAFYGKDYDKFVEEYEKAEASAVNKKVISASSFIESLITERTQTSRIYIMNMDNVNVYGKLKEGVEQSNLCVAGDTLIGVKINDNFSYIEIKELEKYDLDKDEILTKSYNIETDTVEYKRITAFAKTREDSKLVELILDTENDNEPYLYLKVTPDHKIWTYNRGYVEAQYILETDVLSCTDIDGYKISGVKVYEYEEVEDVYDITVEDNHNFYANDILVSNCTEVLLTTKSYSTVNSETGAIATCILSAIVPSNIRDDKEFEEIAELVVRYLDALIDYQEYPELQAEIYTKEWRTLGIGFNNFAHYLAKNKVKYYDKEARDITHEVSEKLQYYTLKASCKLAKEFGAAKQFHNTLYADGILPIDLYKKTVDELVEPSYKMDWEGLRRDIKRYGLRNCTLTTQFPSESSSVLCGFTNGIEPPKDFIVTKRSKAGTVASLVPDFEELAEHYTLLWEQPNNKGYLSLVAIMQKFMDQSLSCNTRYNPMMYNNEQIPFSEVLSDILYIFKYGIKTLYYSNMYKPSAEDMEVGCGSGGCVV